MVVRGGTTVGTYYILGFLELNYVIYLFNFVGIREAVAGHIFS